MLPRFLRLNAPVAIALALVAHALFVTGEQPAEAVPTAYTNTSTGSTPSVRRAGWAGDARVVSFALEGFEAAQFSAGGPSPGPIGVEGITGTITSTAATAAGSFNPNPATVIASGGVIPGFTLTNNGSASADDFFAIDNGIAPLFSGSTVGIATGGLTVASEADFLDITFPASRGVTAVGFDVFTWTTGFLTPVSRTITVQAYAGAGFTSPIFGTAPTVVTNTGGWVFIGVVTDVPILGVRVQDTANSIETIDNLVFNPEPSTFALTALGLLGLVGVARRRRARRTA